MKKTKALVSTALALCIGVTAAVPAFAVSYNEFTYTKIGDYNSDNIVDVSDVTALQLQLGGKGNISDTALEHIDFDGDGSFNVNDITELQKMVVGTEYKCYQEMDSSYKNIPKQFSIDPDYNDYDAVINHELLYNFDYNIENESDNRFNNYTYDLITSKEQFCNVYKAVSPEFDDEFFKDNALFVISTNLDFYDDTGILSFTIKGNTLIIFDYDLDDFRDTGKKININKIYKLNKADIKDIEQIHFYTEYRGQ